MNRDKRNQLFEEKSHLIERTLRRYRGLIQCYWLDPDDVRQELAIKLLNTLEKYDATRCPNLDAYLTVHLRYGLLDLLPCSKRLGIPQAPKKGLTVNSLDASDLFGRSREIPASDVYGNPIWIEREISRLPKPQRLAVNRLLSGKIIRSTNKALIAARLHIKWCVEVRGEEEIRGGICA